MIIEEKRERIMKAAERLFTSRRYHEVTLDEVARTAKVGKGTIYLYFQDKDDLFFQSATYGVDQLCESVRASLPPEASFEEKLRAVCNRIDEFMEARKPAIRTIQDQDARAHAFRGKMRKAWLEHRNRLDALVGGVFAEGIEQGRVRVGLVPEVLARLLLGFMGGRAHAFEDEPEKAPSIDRLVGIFLNGVSHSFEQNS